MKEYDRIKIIRDKKEYLFDGVKKGDEGYIICEKLNGKWLCQFFNDDMSDSVISAISERDLELVSNK